MMHDINMGQHSLRWFLYDEQECANCAVSHSIPEYMLDAMRLLLDTINPYVGQLYHTYHSLPDTTPAYIELENSTTNGEVEVRER